ncbi:MAG: hypothetical protein ACLRFO_01690 [Alphaproteobacteria bacterium]
MLRVAMLNKLKMAKWWAYHTGTTPRPITVDKRMLYQYAIKNGTLIRMSLVRVQLPEPHFTPSCQGAVFVWFSKLFHSSVMPDVKHAIF